METVRQRGMMAWALWGTSFLFAFSDSRIRALWPSVVAIGVVFLVKRVLIGLLAGGAAGVIIIAHGNLMEAFVLFFSDHLIPAMQDSWKIGAVLFTLLLGGFVALIEKGGGLQILVGHFLLRGRDPSRRLQWCTFLIGLIVFFDGLANSLMVGRMMRKMADRCGVSRVKLAYLVDSTSSAVTCLAFISTWIAVQLAMIREGFQLVGMEDEATPYTLFFRSVPYNFYCLFTLFLLAASIAKKFNPGPMGGYEESVRVPPEGAALEKPPRSFTPSRSENGSFGKGAHWLRAVIPIATLIATLMGGIYLSGGDDPLPVTRAKIVHAFGGSKVVIVLVCGSAFASLVAFALYPRGEEREPPSDVFREGVEALFFPVLILLGAWVLSSTLAKLGAAAVISDLLAGRMPLFALPAAVFLVGALISFSTGSAWGTMIILMPLAISVVFGGGGDPFPLQTKALPAAVVGAVFSGAVFGDHCSPISDTTIMSSIACDVETHDHVRTQMPYALIAGGTAVLVGFLPVGLGLSPVYSLFGGVIILWFIPDWVKNHGAGRGRIR